MGALIGLWLPILLSAVFVFIASSVIHMGIQLHKKDYRRMPGEDEVCATIRDQGVEPGEYMFPHCESFKELGTPEAQEKFSKGPVGIMTVLPSGPPTMGKSLVLWFLYSILISVFAGYVGTFCLGSDADYMAVFRLTGTVAVLGYASGTLQNSIWKGQSWIVAGKFVFDGLVYGLITAGTFGWLWPDA